MVKSLARRKPSLKEAGLFIGLKIPVDGESWQA
jgi:hypothetical protein